MDHSLQHDTYRRKIVSLMGESRGGTRDLITRLFLVGGACCFALIEQYDNVLLFLTIAFIISEVAFYFFTHMRLKRKKFEYKDYVIVLLNFIVDIALYCPIPIYFLLQKPAVFQFVGFILVSGFALHAILNHDRD